MASKTKKTKPKSVPKKNAKRYSLRSQTRNKIKKPQPSKLVPVRPTKTKMIKKAPKIIKNSSKANKKGEKSSPIKKHAMICRSVSKNKKPTRSSLQTRSISKILPKIRPRKVTDNSFIKNMLSSIYLKCERKARITLSVSKSAKKIDIMMQKQKQMHPSVKTSQMRSRSKPKPKVEHAKTNGNKANNQPSIKIIADEKVKIQPKKHLQSKKDSKTVEPNDVYKKLMKEALQAKVLRRSIIVKLQDTKSQYNLQKMTIQQLEQLSKCKRQRLYLLDVAKKPEEWNFFVSKVKSKRQTVRITPETISCSCISFRLHRMMCDEIRFIIGTILHNQEVLFHLKFNSQIHQKIYNKLSEQIVGRLPFYFDGCSSQSKADTNQCLICFNDIKQNHQKLEKCDNCSHQFHSICYNIFIRSQQKCPKCKGSIVMVKEELTQPIDELDALKI